MRCDEALALLPAYVEDDVTHEERGALDLHLQECRQCRSALRGEKQVRALLQDDAASRWTPPDLRLLVRQRIASVDTRPRHRLLGAGLVGAVLMLAISVFSWQAQPAAAPAAWPNPNSRAALMPPSLHHARFCLGCTGSGAEWHADQVLADTSIRGRQPDARAAHSGAQYGVSGAPTSIAAKGGERTFQKRVPEYIGLLAS
jgi:hypothetical protein